MPRLGQLTKRVIRGCYGCKKFKVTLLSNPLAGKLPTDRTERSGPFQVVGLNFAGPIGYKIKTRKEGKTYFVIYLKLNESCPHGVAAEPKSCEVHQASQTVHPKKKVTKEDLFV